MTIASVILSDSPALYWKLDDPTGPAASDSSGNGNPGFYVGIVNLGQDGPEAGTQSALFQAGAGVLSVTGTPVTALPFSFDMWVALEGSQPASNVSIYNGSSDTDGAGLVWYAASGAGNPIQLLRGGIGGGGAAGSVPVGTWHHIAQTWSSASTINEYVDGVLRGGPSTVGFNAINANSKFVAGARLPGQLLYAAHAALYPTELSSTRVLAHFNAPSALQTPLPVGSATSSDIAVIEALLNLIYAAVHKTFT
jgi:hypothetical protein